jgi:hypothetical protein
VKNAKTAKASTRPISGDFSRKRLAERSRGGREQACRAEHEAAADLEDHHHADEPAEHPSERRPVGAIGGRARRPRVPTRHAGARRVTRWAAPRIASSTEHQAQARRSARHRPSAAAAAGSPRTRASRQDEKEDADAEQRLPARRAGAFVAHLTRPMGGQHVLDARRVLP